MEEFNLSEADIRMYNQTKSGTKIQDFIHLNKENIKKIEVL